MIRALLKVCLPLLLIAAAAQAKADGLSYRYIGPMFGFGGEREVVHAMYHMDLALHTDLIDVKKNEAGHALDHLFNAHFFFRSIDGRAKIALAMQHLKLFIVGCNPADLQCAYDAALAALLCEKTFCGCATPILTTINYDLGYPHCFNFGYHGYGYVDPFFGF